MARLGDYIKIMNGFAFKSKQYVESGIRVLRITNVQKGEIVDYDPKFYPKETLEQLKRYSLDSGDLLMSLTGNVGRVGRVKNEHLPAYVNQRVCKIKSDSPELDEDYLFHLLNSEKFERDSIQNSSGVAQLNLSTKWVENYEINLPPLETQRKIAAILDTADEYRQKTKALIEKYDALAQSLFLDMFGDPVTNPKGWENMTVESFAKQEKGSIKRGPFGGALKKEIFVEDGYLVYEQYHALNNDFTFARYFIDESKFEEMRGFEVKPGDIIISCSGVYLGKLAIVPEGARPGIINQALLKLTIDQSVMTNHFFTFHFRQENFRDKFFGANRGAGIPNFPPMKDFKTFPFIVPPIELQVDFEKRIKQLEEQQHQAEMQIQKSEDLFNSLLQKAFRGELV